MGPTACSFTCRITWSWSYGYGCQHLSNFEDRLSGLKRCYRVTDAELTASTACPHSAFMPANESLPLGPPMRTPSSMKSWTACSPPGSKPCGTT